jgi:hypothetical protein
MQQALITAGIYSGLAANTGKIYASEGGKM